MRLALIAILLLLSEARHGSYRHSESAEDRAAAFLAREVPAWSRDNGCYSCHNDGDGARALYIARRRGLTVPPESLTATTRWLLAPNRWDENKGDPGVSDKVLADIQFAASLAEARKAGEVKEDAPLHAAARRLVAKQSANGSWPVDIHSLAGSPATYGTPLATAMAARFLRSIPGGHENKAVERAGAWLTKAEAGSVTAASAILLGLPPHENTAKLRSTMARKLVGWQLKNGGWGPYPASPPEAFDTAVALIALYEVRSEPGVGDAIRRGRDYLVRLQERDGGWPATTRPSGGESYAQRISTSGWALIALIESSKRAGYRQRKPNAIQELQARPGFHESRGRSRWAVY